MHPRPKHLWRPMADALVENPSGRTVSYNLCNIVYVNEDYFEATSPMAYLELANDFGRRIRKHEHHFYTNTWDERLIYIGRGRTGCRNSRIPYLCNTDYVSRGYNVACSPRQAGNVWFGAHCQKRIHPTSTSELKSLSAAALAYQNLAKESLLDPYSHCTTII